MATGAVSVVNTGNTGRACAIFGGVDVYVNASTFYIPENQTISFWALNLEDPMTGSDNAIWTFEDGSVSYAGIQLWVNVQHKLHVLVSDGTSYVINQSAYKIPTGIWKHYTITYTANNANGLKIYIDGVEIVSYSTTGIGSISGTFERFIGYRPGHNTKWYGSMADVKIYNKALSQEEITKNYLGSNVTDGLISNWKLIDDYKDSAGNNDGTNFGTYFGITEDSIAEAIAAQRVTANDQFLIYKGMGGQVGSVAIEEAP